MQARQADEPRAFALFEEACNRVASIASIHELLYRSGSVAPVDGQNTRTQCSERTCFTATTTEKVPAVWLGL